MKQILLIGICFYELMTGHCPNKEIENEFEIYEKIIKEHPHLPLPKNKK